MLLNSFLIHIAARLAEWYEKQPPKRRRNLFYLFVFSFFFGTIYRDSGIFSTIIKFYQLGFITGAVAVIFTRIKNKGFGEAASEALTAAEEKQKERQREISRRSEEKRQAKLQKAAAAAAVAASPSFPAPAPKASSFAPSPVRMKNNPPPMPAQKDVIQSRRHQQDDVVVRRK